MVTNHSWPLQRQSWPTTAFLIVCVFFFIVGSIARFRHLDAPALRDEENDQYDLHDHEQLSFDIRNGTTTTATSSSVSVLPSPKSSSYYADHQIESNLTFFNVSSSSETSSLESNISETGESAVLPNRNNALSQASKDEGNMENDDHISQTQQQQKEEMQSTTQPPPTK